MSGPYHTKSLWFSKDFLNLVKNNIHHNELGFNENLHNIKFNFGTNKNTNNNTMKLTTNKIPFHMLQRYVYDCSFFHKLQNTCKYEALYNVLFCHVFDEKCILLYSLEMKQKIANIYLFNRLQSILFSFRKLIYIFRMKHKSRIYNESSLLMDEFKNNEQVLSIYDFNNINYKSEYMITCYKFNASDLYNIVEKNIVSYDAYLVYDNIDLKNPYNNISFTYCQLWNIYFFLRDKSLKSIPMFTLYFSCNFDKSLFILKYDYALRNHIIDDYYRAISNSVKLSIFQRILEQWYPIKFHYHHLNVEILYEFFNEKQHLIYDYLMYKYSYNITLSQYHLSQIKKSLQKTYDKNPLLGRKIRTINQDNSRNYTVNNGNGVY